MSMQDVSKGIYVKSLVQFGDKTLSVNASDEFSSIFMLSETYKKILRIICAGL